MGKNMKQMKGLKSQAGFLGGLFSGGDPATSQSQSNSQASSVSNQQVNPFQFQGGLFNGGFGPDGNINQGVGGAIGQLQGQNIAGAGQFNNLGLTAAQGAAGGAAAAGQAGLGFLQNAQQDPFAMQQQLFNQQNQILAPLQEQERLAQESRLFSQGRLGSQGTLSGAGQQEALLNAQAQQTQGLFNQSFNQGQAFQGQQGDFANQFLQFNPQAAGLFGNLGAQQQGGALNIDQQSLAALGIGGQLNQEANAASESLSSSSSNATGPTQGGLLNQLGQGLIAGGVQGITQGLGGLFPLNNGFIGNDGPGGVNRV